MRVFTGDLRDAFHGDSKMLGSSRHHVFEPPSAECERGGGVEDVRDGEEEDEDVHVVQERRAEEGFFPVGADAVAAAHRALQSATAGVRSAG